MTQEAFNEIQVLQSCAAGDTAAFEVIVHKYQSLVCAITFSAVGQVEKSEELAQQAFINAWKGLNTLKDLENFKAWLIGITRNVIRTFYRTQKRDIVNNAAAIDGIGDIADRSTEPLEAIITKEQETIVQQSLHQIPEMYREPLVLFYRQQQSTREVAEALDLTEEAVRTRMMRGRKMLKEHLTQMVESTLSHTGPGKAFTTMVVASIAGLTLTGSTATAASGTATGAATTGTATGLATVMSTITAKVITAAAVVAVVVGVVLTYQHLTESDQSTTQSNEIAVVQDQQGPAATPENTETPQPEALNVLTAAIEAPENKTAALQDSINVESTSNAESISISQTTEISEPAEYVFEPNGVLSGLITDIE
ncbi:MAG: RNA polymerase sigma factor, partial [Planctomycetota bacterium]